jgi:hypothetical protein
MGKVVVRFLIGRVRMTSLATVHDGGDICQSGKLF